MHNLPSDIQQVFDLALRGINNNHNNLTSATTEERATLKRVRDALKCTMLDHAAEIIILTDTIGKHEFGVYGWTDKKTGIRGCGHCKEPADHPFHEINGHKLISFLDDEIH